MKTFMTEHLRAWRGHFALFTLTLNITSVCAAVGPVIGTVQISTIALPTQSGGFNVQKGTATVEMSVPYISGTQCLHTTPLGIITGTGADCGVGSVPAAGSVIVNVATQYGSAYYSASGSSNTISGLSPGTAGQFLTTQGGSGPPTWTSSPGGYFVQPATVTFNLAQGVSGTTFTFTGPAQSAITYGVTIGSITLPSLAANQCLQTNVSSQIITTGSGCSSAGSFINNTSSLQSNATFYVSSGTVNTLNVGVDDASTHLFVLGKGINLNSTNGPFGAPISLNFFNSNASIESTNANSAVVSPINSAGIYINNASGHPVFYTKTAPGAPFVVINSSDAATTGTLAFAGTQPGPTQYVGFTSSAGVNLAGTVWVLPQQDGTNGQVLTTDGSSHLSFVTASGASLLPSTQTWTGQNNWTTPAQSTFTYGLTVGTLTVNGAGAGAIQLTEGTDTGVFSPVSTKDNFWASSSSHSFVTNYNGASSTGTIVVSTSAPTIGHFATFSGQGSLVDGGGTSTLPQGPNASVQYNNNGILAGSGNFQFSGTSTTINSSMTVTLNGGIPSIAGGQLTIYDGNSYTGKLFLTVGSNLLNNQVSFPDHQPINATNYGIQAGNLTVGNPTFSLDEIYGQSANNYINFYSGNGINGEMVLQTNTLNKPIVLQPGTVDVFEASSTVVSVKVPENVYISTTNATAFSLSTATISGVTSNVPYFAISTQTVTNSQALCLINNQLGHCTTVVGAGGGCTCVSP